MLGGILLPKRIVGNTIEHLEIIFPPLQHNWIGSKHWMCQPNWTINMIVDMSQKDCILINPVEIYTQQKKLVSCLKVLLRCDIERLSFEVTFLRWVFWQFLQTQNMYQVLYVYGVFKINIISFQDYSSLALWNTQHSYSLRNYNSIECEDEIYELPFYNHILIPVTVPKAIWCIHTYLSIKVTDKIGHLVS